MTTPQKCPTHYVAEDHSMTSKELLALHELMHGAAVKRERGSWWIADLATGQPKVFVHGWLSYLGCRVPGHVVGTPDNDLVAEAESILEEVLTSIYDD